MQLIKGMSVCVCLLAFTSVWILNVCQEDRFLLLRRLPSGCLSYLVAFGEQELGQVGPVLQQREEQMLHLSYQLLGNQGGQTPATSLVGVTQ